MFRFLVTVSCLIGCAVGFPQGASENACGTLFPGHGITPLPNPGYTVNAQGSSGGVYTVTLAGPQGRVFKGFMIQAFSANDQTTVVGSFGVNSSNEKVMCPNNSGVTHSNTKVANTVTVQWQGPVGTPVFFKATVVEEYNKIYTEITSPVVVA